MVQGRDRWRWHGGPVRPVGDRVDLGKLNGTSLSTNTGNASQLARAACEPGG